MKNKLRINIFLVTLGTTSCATPFIVSCKSNPQNKIMLRNVTRKNNLSNMYFVLPKYGWEYNDTFMDDYYFDKTIYLFKYHDLAVKYSDEENYFYLDINFHLENYEHQHYSKMAIDGSDKNGIFCISMHKDFYSDQLNFGYSDNFDETHNSIYVQLQDNIDFQYYAIVEPNTQTLCDGLNKWLDQCYFAKDRPVYEQ